MRFTFTFCSKRMKIIQAIKIIIIYVISLINADNFFNTG